MFSYEKKLQYPVKIDKPNPRLAALIISQYGGPDGELGASLRYLSQRYSMPFDELKGLLTDIGTEAAEKACLKGSLFDDALTPPPKREILQIYINLLIFCNHHFVQQFGIKLFVQGFSIQKRVDFFFDPVAVPVLRCKHPVEPVTGRR